MFVVKYRKIFYIFSAIILLASITSFSIWGLKLGIDFKGGSILEVAYKIDTTTSVTDASIPTQGEIIEAVKDLKLQESVRATGVDGYIIKMRDITHTEKLSLDSALKKLTPKDGKYEEKRFDSVGPLLGKEAARNSVLSIILVIVAIVLFIAYAFRQVSEPVSSWKYGIIAIIALVHDVIIPAGVFSVLGHFKDYEVDTLFVTALLVVLGFSVHDTIVVFDRVRENLKHAVRKPFEDIVGESISQTFARSINTSLTTILALVVLYFVGGQATEHFSLALIIGIIAGTYSSIFIGSPLLVTFEKWASRKNKTS